VEVTDENEDDSSLLLAKVIYIESEEKALAAREVKLDNLNHLHPFFFRVNHHDLLRYLTDPDLEPPHHLY